MRKQFATLQRIENNRRITAETDFDFLYHLQNTLLLALREQGTITPMQQQHAQEALKKQRRNWAVRKQAQA